MIWVLLHKEKNVSCNSVAAPKNCTKQLQVLSEPAKATEAKHTLIKVKAWTEMKLLRGVRLQELCWCCQASSNERMWGKVNKRV